MGSFEDFLKLHLEKLQIEHDFASGYIDTEPKYLLFREDLSKFGFHFTIRSSRKEQYSEDGEKKAKKSTQEKNDSNENNSTDVSKKMKKMPGRGGVMYKSCTDVSVPFFGSPFLIETTTYLTCSQGIKYYGSKKYPDELFNKGDPFAKKRRKEKSSQKIGCQARMTVKKIKVFPGVDYLLTSDNWREKRAAIDMLRLDFLDEKTKIESFMRFYIVISRDTVHNHEPQVKNVKKSRCTTYDPARRVLKLHEQFQEAIVMLNSEFVTQCTNVQTLTHCCNTVKLVISQIRESIEKGDGVPMEQMTAAIDKLAEKQMKSNSLLERKAAKRKTIKIEKPFDEVTEPVEIKMDDPMEENNENSQVIELPNLIEGSQVVWDPLSVSWVQDGQSIVLQEANSVAQPGQRKEHQPTQSILLQRLKEDMTPQHNQNIGVITQSGQNYTIVQHTAVPNIGVNVPLTMAKVVHPTALLTQNVKKGGGSKRNEMGVTAIAIPAEWGQQNWGQITQVVSEGQNNFTNCPTQTVWSITQ